MSVICLQGGRENTPACAGLDDQLLEIAGRGAVTIVALADENLHNNSAAAALAERHFRSLGATDVTQITDRADPLAIDAVRRARLVLMPGGSPRVLLDALRTSGLDQAIVRAAADGAVISGASAGAMVLCRWMVQPGRPMEVVPGVGLVEDLVVLPHYSGGHDDWVAAVRGSLGDGVDLIGIPECSGVLLDGEALVAVGAEATTLITAEGSSRLAL